jgi:hypothetical protein
VTLTRIKVTVPKQATENQHIHERRDLFDRCAWLTSLCNMYYEICGDLVEGYGQVNNR